MHGYYLAISEQKKTFGIYINGRKHGMQWHAFPGGSFLCTPGSDASSDRESSFIYPDFETVLHGSFDVPTSYALIRASSATLASDVALNSFGIMQPQCLIFPDCAEFNNHESNDSICAQPTLKDPYEEKYVIVKESLIPNAGQGLFALKSIVKGQLLAFFHGVPTASADNSDYSIRCHNFMIDIPQKCRKVENYCATLAHKICHSFQPNADYSYAFHPRFGGLIRCAIAIRDIAAGQEITCNYKYKLEKAPQWYVQALKDYLETNTKLTADDIEQVMLRK